MKFEAKVFDFMGSLNYTLRLKIKPGTTTKYKFCLRHFHTN